MELQPNEQLIKVVRKPILVYSFQLLASLVLILGAFFFMVPLFRLILWSQTWIGKTFFGILIGLGVIFGLKVLINWLGNKLIITNQRLIIILQKGFFSQKIFKINYEKIRHIDLMIKGFFQTIFHWGTLQVSLVESADILEFFNLARPGTIQETIINLQNKSHKSNLFDLNQIDDFQATQIARRIRDKIGREKFQEIADETRL